MGKPAAVVWDRSFLGYDLGGDHPLNPVRLDLTVRLATALGRKYGRDIQLNVIVDPNVVGGVRVDIGDEVIDGTIAARLDEAQRRIAG